MLASPAIAIVIGAVAGVGLLAPVLWGYRFFAADKIEVGLAVVMGAVFVGLLLAVGALFLYRALSPGGLVWFGASLVGGYLVALVVFAVRTARAMLESDNDIGR